MTDIATAVITGFVSAFTMFLGVVAFTGRQIGDVKAELKDEIGSLRTDLRGEIADLRTDLGGEIGSLRTDLRGESVDLRTEVRADIRRLDEKFDQMMFEVLRHVR